MKKDFSRRLKGFTMLELLISMAISCIVVISASPYVSKMVSKHRMDTEVTNFRASLGYARSVALNKNMWVTIRKINTWSDGWYIFTDENNDGVKNNLDEVLKTHQLPPNSLKIDWSRDISRLSYGPRGTTNGATQNTARFCLMESQNTTHAFNTAIIFNTIGRTRIVQGTTVVC
ncbi:MAG: GspH/FimT family pseudopilin [Endozoicomonadaceae bacterium]|nr:GspH/FimT family pseudopilin [Endozoicomonadaceae bacterium]